MSEPTKKPKNKTAAKTKETLRKKMWLLQDKIAKVFGAERVAADNETKDHASVKHDELFIQCQYIKDKVDIYSLYDSTTEKSPTNKIPLVVLRSDYKRPIVVMDLGDFVSSYKEANEELIGENKELRDKVARIMKKYQFTETAKERRDRINTHPYMSFGKYTELHKEK